MNIPKEHKQRLEWLYDRYGKRLSGYAIKVYHLSEDAAWDLTYKSLYKVNEKFEGYSFKHEKALNGFVFRVMLNYLKNHFRDTRHHPEKVDLEDHHVETIEDHERNNPLMVALETELEKLEDWERMLLLLRSQEMSYKEISHYVNKPEKQLKVYYQRLKERITERLQSSDALKAKQDGK